MNVYIIVGTDREVLANRLTIYMDDVIEVTIEPNEGYENLRSITS